MVIQYMHSKKRTTQNLNKHEAIQTSKKQSIGLSIKIIEENFFPYLALIVSPLCDQ